MKLDNDKINAMAGELLGICSKHEWTAEPSSGLVLCLQCKRSKHHESTNPDFIHDANAVRRLVLWLVENGSALQECHFLDFLLDGAYTDCPLYALALPPKTITIAVLYAAGKITLEQAKEAMNES